MNKIIISLPDLENFAEWLIAYGNSRGHVEAENCGIALKSIFLNEDKFVREDLAEFSGGQIEYKSKT
jgi:hypothetical protein